MVSSSTLKPEAPQFLTVVSEAGGVVIDKLPLFNYSEYPVLFLRDTAVAKTNDGRLIVLSRKGERLDSFPAMQGEVMNSLAKSIIGFNASYLYRISSTDYFGNTYYEDLDYKKHDESGGIIFSKKNNAPWGVDVIDGPYAMGNYTTRIVSGSGVIYYLALNRKGIDIYRCIPPAIYGKAYMRLSKEKTMLELAQKGIGESPTAEEMKYLDSLLPGELRVLANASLALKGYFFPDEDIDLEEYFLTWGWYKPGTIEDNGRIVLTPAQKRLVALATSRMKAR